MRTAKNNTEAKKLIKKGENFRLDISLTKQIKDLIVKYVPNHTQGIVLETGEVIVLTTLIVAVGSCIAYAIYRGYSVRLRKDKKKWYLEFKKKDVNF